MRQFGEWGNTDEGRHILIAVARYLAAHSPESGPHPDFAVTHLGGIVAELSGALTLLI